MEESRNSFDGADGISLFRMRDSVDILEKGKGDPKTILTVFGSPLFYALLFESAFFRYAEGVTPIFFLKAIEKYCSDR